MKYIQKAREAISAAESVIRTLIQEAAQRSDYRAITDLAKLAERVGEIGNSLGDETSEGDERADYLRMADEESSLHSSRDNERFPYFRRDDEFLVKVGSSRAGGSKYEHRAPKGAIDLVVLRILAASSMKRSFTAERLTNVAKHRDGATVPTYQIYLCLSWFKREKLIKQHGRKGYSISKPQSFAANVEEAWTRLETPRRRANG